MRESAIQAKVVAYARARGVICRKLDFGQGWPDYMLLYKGRIAFIEFKTLKGRLRPLQGHVIALLERNKFDVAVVNEVGHGLMIVDLLVN